MKSLMMIIALGLFAVSSCDTMRTTTGEQDNGFSSDHSDNTRTRAQAEVNSEKKDFRIGQSTEFIERDADTTGRIRTLSNTEDK